MLTSFHFDDGVTTRGGESSGGEFSCERATARPRATPNVNTQLVVVVQARDVVKVQPFKSVTVEIDADRERDKLLAVTFYYSTDSGSSSGSVDQYEELTAPRLLFCYLFIYVVGGAVAWLDVVRAA